MTNTAFGKSHSWVQLRLYIAKSTLKRCLGGQIMRIQLTGKVSYAKRAAKVFYSQQKPSGKIAFLYKRLF